MLPGFLTNGRVNRGRLSVARGRNALGQDQDRARRVLSNVFDFEGSHRRVGRNDTRKRLKNRLFQNILMFIERDQVESLIKLGVSEIGIEALWRSRRSSEG